MTTEDKKPIIKQEGAPPVQQQQKRYRKRGNRRFYRKANNTQNTKLKGKTEELDGFVYDVGSMSQAQLFADTTREIAEYAGRTLKEAQDIRMAIEDLEEITLNRPTKTEQAMTRKIQRFLKLSSIVILRGSTHIGKIKQQCIPSSWGNVQTQCEPS